MGFFSEGNDKRMVPIQAGLGANAADFGAQAGGATDRSTAQWGGQGALYGEIGDMLRSGAFDDPGQAARAVDYGNMPQNMDWWKAMQGTSGMARLKDTAGKDITTFSEIANNGMMTPEQMYAMRERPASQARSATSSFMDNLRRGGVSGWGGGGPAASLAALKNLTSSNRQGNLEANANIADQTNQQRQWGYGQMTGAQGNIQNLDDMMRQERISAASTARRGSKAGLGDWLGYLQADPNGSALDWSKMANADLQGQTSALSGWGNSIQQGKTESGLNKSLRVMDSVGNFIGNVAGAAKGAAVASDISFKTNITRPRHGLSSLRGLKTYSYTYIDDIDKDSQQGLMAQDLEKVAPEFVIDTPEGKYINTYGVLAMVIEAVKELDHQINGRV